MRHMETSRRQTNLGGDDVCTIVYYVTVDDFIDITSGIQLESYGVGITICGCDEMSVIPHISFNLDSVMRLSQILAEQLVTPTTLGDIIEDWLVSSQE